MPAIHELRARRAQTDARIFELARLQDGIVSRRALLLAGISRYAIDRRLKSGLLTAVHAGVYRVGPMSAPETRELAALLACPAGVLSHNTAGATLRLLPPQDASELMHVTVPRGHQCRRRSGIRAHRAKLARDEVQIVGSLRVTTPARTILDLASVLGGRALEQALATAERSYPDVVARASALIDRYPRRHGTPLLRAVIGAPCGRAFTRSEAEEQLLTLVRLAGLPEPQTNTVIQAVEVDFFWKRAKLVVEVDGYEFHNSRRSFEKDHRRDSALAAAGIRVVRFTWKQLTEEREKTLVQLAQALARGET